MIFENGKLLIVERASEPFKGYWSLPGGILETGEKLETGVRREVREETGLEVEPLSVFEIFEDIRRLSEKSAKLKRLGREASKRVATLHEKLRRLHAD